jgi:predicted outer membrane protein
MPPSSQETTTISALALTILLLGACHGELPFQKHADFDRSRFLNTTARGALGDREVSLVAAKRGRSPETRRLGADIVREQQTLYRKLLNLAQAGGVTVPPGLEEKKAALRDNLLLLQPELFDRAYALAMVQDLGTELNALQVASRSGDEQLAALASEQLPLIEARHKDAAAVLKSVGGSPFEGPVGE